MLLKRQEKDNKIKALYESSNVLASTYDPETQDLIIIFKAGNQYKYSSVSKTDYFRFETAESQGDIFNSYIKKYTFEKLEKIDPSKIIAEATILKADEDKALLEARKKKLMDSIKRLVLIDDDLNHTNEQLLNGITAVKTEIETFLNTQNKTS